MFRSSMLAVPNACLLLRSAARVPMRLAALGLGLALLLVAPQGRADVTEDIERQVQSGPHEALAAARAGLAAARAAQNRPAELRMLRTLVMAEGILDDSVKAGSQIETGLALARALSDVEAECEMLVAMGDGLRSLPRVAEAEAAYKQAEQLAAQTGHRRQLARALYFRGLLYEDSGRNAESLALFAAALSVAEAEGDRFGAARALNGLASTSSGSTPAAQRQRSIGLFRNALDLIDRDVYVVFTGTLMHNLGMTLVSDGDLSGARTMYAGALLHARKLGNRRQQAFLHYRLAAVDLAEDHAAEALVHLDIAEPLLQELAAPGWHFNVRLRRADALARLGARQASLESLASAQKLLAPLKAARRDVSYFDVAAQIHARLGDMHEAYELMRRLRDADKAAAGAANDALAAELRTRFDAERKEKDNEVLRAQQRESDARRLVLILALACTVLLLFGLAVMLRLQVRRKRRERERFEQEAVALEDKRRLAEAANLEKSRFLAAASHDLRQPVHAMNLYLGTLAGFELPAAATALLANARQCGQSMDEMFRTVLDVSRLDAGALHADIEEFALEPLLERIRLQFGPQARLKGLVLKVPASRLRLKSDPQLVERIVHNFVANAVRYTSQGKVLVGARRRGTQVRLSVFDTGPGVPAGEQQRIFEEFYQLDAARHERTKGLGLGLAIVRRLAALLQAPLVLRSVPGKGSCFAVDLPCAQDSRLPLAAPAPVPAPALAADALRALQGALLLVVDDDESIRQATRVLLEQCGAEVITAASSEELFENTALSQRIPDGLICDYRLRAGADGIGLVAQVRTEFNHEIPALLITGETSAQSLRQIQASGLPVLHKPLMPDELRNELLGLMQHAERQTA